MTTTTIPGLTSRGTVLVMVGYLPDKILVHAHDCAAASRGTGGDVKEREFGSVAEFVAYKAEFEAEAKALGEAGIRFHPCTKAIR